MPTVQDKGDIGQLRDPSLDAGQFPIVPSDTVNLRTPIDSVYVGLTGDIVYMPPDGSLVTLKSVPTGAKLRLNAIRIMATGTTATLMTGFSFKADRK